MCGAGGRVNRFRAGGGLDGGGLDGGGTAAAGAGGASCGRSEDGGGCGRGAKGLLSARPGLRPDSELPPPPPSLLSESRSFILVAKLDLEEIEGKAQIGE